MSRQSLSPVLRRVDLQPGLLEEDGAGVVEGEYRVVLPDTRTQIVKYRVTPDTGYVAEVTYEGTPAAPL